MAKITIEIDEKAKYIKIVTDTGEEFFLQSLSLFGGDAEKKELFIKMFGASADSAWAYGEGFKIAHGPEGGRALKSFYKQCAAHVCMAIDPNAFKNELGAEELINKWESDDQSKWFGWDSEDVLEDKQRSEKKKETIH